MMFKKLSVLSFLLFVVLPSFAMRLENFEDVLSRTESESDLVNLKRRIISRYNYLKLYSNASASHLDLELQKISDELSNLADQRKSIENKLERIRKSKFMSKYSR